MILLERALEYANDVIDGKEITTWEVKKQCEIFINDYNNRQYVEEFRYYFDEEELQTVNDLLKLLNFATGFVAGEQVLESLVGFQCFFIANIFGWRFKDRPEKFRYNDNTLFIARKNAKTALIGIVFILLMLTSQQYSEFYSICLTKELAAEIKKSMEQIIEVSSQIKRHFNVSTTKTGRITCKLTNCFFEPRVSEAGKNNSIRSEAFVSDEHANFTESSNFQAMRSGQRNVINGLVFRTTTAYAINGSIMEEDLDYIRKVLRDEIEDERQFALVYYADKGNEWIDEGIYQANPLRIEENYETMREDRKTAQEKASAVEEFLTKTLNIFLQENEEEKYIDIKEWKKCRVEEIDFEGKEVAVGVDASLTTDLTAVTIMYKEKGNYYLKSKGFLPEESLSKRREKIDYRSYEEQGYCKVTEGHIVDYEVLDEYIRSIEERYNCTIKYLVSDPYNIIQTIQGIAKDFPHIEVIVRKQTYTELSPPNKSFMTDVYKQRVFYEKNDLLDWNMSNTTTVKGRVTEDILLAKTNKNKQRIDLVMATIFAYSELYLEEEIKDVFYSPDI